MIKQLFHLHVLLHTTDYLPAILLHTVGIPILVLSVVVLLSEVLEPVYTRRMQINLVHFVCSVIMLVLYDGGTGSHPVLVCHVGTCHSLPTFVWNYLWYNVDEIGYFVVVVVVYLTTLFQQLRI
jgi:uncharacterized membrane protein YGL010W